MSEGVVEKEARFVQEMDRIHEQMNAATTYNEKKSLLVQMMDTLQSNLDVLALDKYRRYRIVVTELFASFERELS